MQGLARGGFGQTDRALTITLSASTCTATHRYRRREPSRVRRGSPLQTTCEPFPSFRVHKRARPDRGEMSGGRARARIECRRGRLKYEERNQKQVLSYCKIQYADHESRHPRVAAGVCCCAVVGLGPLAYSIVRAVSPRHAGPLTGATPTESSNGPPLAAPGQATCVRARARAQTSASPSSSSSFLGLSSPPLVPLPPPSPPSLVSSSLAAPPP